MRTFLPLKTAFAITVKCFVSTIRTANTLNTYSPRHKSEKLIRPSSRASDPNNEDGMKMFGTCSVLLIVFREKRTLECS